MSDQCPPAAPSSCWLSVDMVSLPLRSRPPPATPCNTVMTSQLQGELLTSLMGILSTRPGHRPSLVQILLQSLMSWMVMLYLRLSPARVSPSVTTWSRNWVQWLLEPEQVP